jgi:hypothetical protein
VTNGSTLSIRSRLISSSRPIVAGSSLNGRRTSAMAESTTVAAISAFSARIS